MKNKFILLLSVFYFLANAQVTNKQNPRSWSFGNIETTVVEMPSFDLNKVRSEDRLKDKQFTKPYRFGYGFEVNFDIKNSGVWTDLPNGSRIWHLTFESKGAQTLNFIFTNFELAKGAELYVYSSDKTSKLGPFNSQLNNDSRKLGTWPIDGDKITIELYEPKAVVGLSTLQVSKVVHGYRSKAPLSPGDSDPCNYDVDCEIGDPFDIQKKAIMLIIGEEGDAWCSGTLLNNTAEDKKPYVMSADHCFSHDIGSTIGEMAFRFNWKAAEPQCPGSTDEIGDGTMETSYGAIAMAKNPLTDFFLLKIANPIPEDWDVVFAGWNRSPEAPEGVTVGLSHPSGDLMKISLNEDPLTDDDVEMGPNFWEVTEWEKGVTEPGSSGSGLFNANGEFIGNLYGGYAACDGNEPNDSADYYGKLSITWAEGGTPQNSVKDYLDPVGSNPDVIDYFPNLEEMKTTDINNSKQIKVYPNPAHDVVNVELLNPNLAEFKLFDFSGKIIKKGELHMKSNKIDIKNLPKGVYILRVKTSAQETLSTKLVVQ